MFELGEYWFMVTLKYELPQKMEKVGPYDFHSKDNGDRILKSSHKNVIYSYSTNLGWINQKVWLHTWFSKVQKLLKLPSMCGNHNKCAKSDIRFKFVLNSC